MTGLARVAWFPAFAGMTVFAGMTGALLGGCAIKTERMFVDGEMALLAAPYPLDHPEGESQPNRLIRTLHDEHVEVLETFAHKQFLVSKVRTRDGDEGYVVCCSSGGAFVDAPPERKSPGTR